MTKNEETGNALYSGNKKYQVLNDRLWMMMMILFSKIF
jgi:hypothetical protein